MPSHKKKTDADDANFAKDDPSAPADDSSLQSSAYADDIHRIMAACAPECEALEHEHQGRAGVVGAGPGGRVLLELFKKFLLILLEKNQVQAVGTPKE